MTKGVGYFLRFVVGGIVITLIINLFFFNHPTPTEENIKSFTDDLKIITDEIKKQVISNEEFFTAMDKRENFLGYNTGSVKTSYSRSRNSRLYYVKYIYYSSKYKKYFEVYAVSQGVNALTRIINEKHISYYLTVNKGQLNDPSYGDLQNPVPVFQVKGINESMKEDNLDYDETYMKEVFQKNIEGYLYYIIPKNEFYKLFLEHKNFWNSLF